MPQSFLSIYKNKLEIDKLLPAEFNQNNNFIAGWHTLDLKLCDDLINLFETSSYKRPGASSQNKVDLEIKKSTDIALPDNLTGNRYKALLDRIVDQYLDLYPYAGPVNLLEFEGANIQHYAPGEGFYIWHTERHPSIEEFNKRHLVFMTYLNDVTDGGQTEWYHQKVKLSPVKGLTVIWPADWMFMHRGITSKSQNKYIVTGWFRIK